MHVKTCNREKRENFKIVFEVLIESKIVLYKLNRFRLMSKAENAAKPILNFIKRVLKNARSILFQTKFKILGMGKLEL